MNTNGHHVYFYGLPSDNTSSNQIKKKIKEMTDIDIGNNPPQIRRQHLQNQWTAIVKLENAAEQEKVLDKMRFFDWDADQGKKPVQIRALAYDEDIKDPQKNKDQNVFIRCIPKDKSHSDLYELLKEIIEEKDLKSVKVSIDSDSNQSRGFGFCFCATAESASKLKEMGEKHGIKFHA